MNGPGPRQIGRCTAILVILALHGALAGCQPAKTTEPAPTTLEPLPPPAEVVEGAPPTAPAPAEPPPPTGVEALPVFPEGWQGTWTGSCTAFFPDGRVNTFPMSLRIEPLGEPPRWSWTLVYGEDELRQERPYELIVMDAAQGHYRIDEQNSIEVDAYLAGNSLYAAYSVEGALISVIYRCNGETIEFELLAGNFDTPLRSGGTGEIPVVQAYPIQVAQRAVLTRQ